MHTYVIFYAHLCQTKVDYLAAILNNQWLSYAWILESDFVQLLVIIHNSYIIHLHFNIQHFPCHNTFFPEKCPQEPCCILTLDDN